MRRLLPLLTAAALIAIGLATWRILGDDGPTPPAPVPSQVARPAGASALDAAPGTTPALEAPLAADAGGLEVRVTARRAPVAGAAIRVYLHRAIEPGTGRPGWRLVGTGATGADGLARLAAAPGAYLVSARAQGHAPALEEVVRPAGEPLTRLDLALAAPLALEGRTVERGSGEPVPATAILLSREPERGAPRGDLPTEERAFAQSDGRGRFTLPGLAPGRYTLEAEAAGHARVRLTGVAVPRAGPLEVTLSAAGLVEGLVLDAEGRPAEGAEVAFTGGEQVLVVSSGPSGGFAAEVPPRSWRLSARRGDAAAALAAPVVVAAGQSVRGLQLRLGTPALLQGVVVTSTGAPVPGATVGLSPAGEGGELGRTATGADGRFAFRGLAAGAYDLDAGADGFAPVIRHGLLLAAGDTFEVRLTLSGTGAVEGTVSDAQGRPLAGARLRGGKLWGSMGQVDAEAVSGEDGHYRLGGLEPGRTTVRARRSEALSGASQLLLVEEGRATRADFTLPGTGTIEGTVRTPTGQPPPSPVRVVLFQAGPGRGGMGGRQPEVVPTDAGGQFKALVPEGSWRLVALAGDEERRRSRAEPVAAEVVADRTSRADLTLEEPGASEAGGTLTVEVREPDGAPSPGAMVLTQRAGARNPNTFYADETGRAVLPLVSGEAARAQLSVGGRSGGRTAPLTPVAPGAAIHLVQLLPAASLRGEVRDGGRPVAGARISMESGRDLPGPGQEVQRELPGASFAFADLLPGTLALTATTTDGRLGAQEVVLTSGAEQAVVVEVRRGATVTGRVVDAAGAPVAGAYVWVGDQPHADEGTSSDGRFRLVGVPTGPQQLRAFLLRASASRELSLVAGQELDVGDLALARGGASAHP
jgi:protocatechuate 3,4-dioxygenase beta subunit